jgi:hypothetical protein
LVERSWLFRWASEVGAHSMPHPEELEYLGYTFVGIDPRYQGAVLMRKEAIPCQEIPGSTQP